MHKRGRSLKCVAASATDNLAKREKVGRLSRATKVQQYVCTVHNICAS